MSFAKHANNPNVVPLQRQRQRRRRRSAPNPATRVVLQILMLASVVAAAVIGKDHVSHPVKSVSTPVQRAHFTTCGSGKRHTCIVDGDTVWFRGEKMRLYGINAPELSSPFCQKEARLAKTATLQLKTILNTHAWSITRYGKDRYGRTLSQFNIGETTAGDMLIAKGLAHKWRGFKRSWC